MKLLLLSDINSSHTQKWAIEFSRKGLNVGIFSISKPVLDWYSKHGIQLLNKIYNSGELSKLTYIKLLPQLKIAISKFKPGLIHAHYATSYGLLGALSKFHPFVISAWGSDIMEFPNKSWLHKKTVMYNLSKADSVWATSDILVAELKKLTNKNIHKVPFGIDTDYFKPAAVENVFSSKDIVVGTIKSLETIYGIDILIKAFKKAVEANPSLLLKLLVVGGGSKELEYKNLAQKLSIIDKTIFTGKVEYSKVVDYHNMIDIFVNVSRNESFGVSVLEAAACEKPVVAANIGGLKEVVEDGMTGILVQPADIDAVANAIDRLIKDERLRKEMGLNGRLLVQKKFNISDNVDKAISIYKQLLNK